MVLIEDITEQEAAREAAEAAAAAQAAAAAAAEERARAAAAAQQAAAAASAQYDSDSDYEEEEGEEGQQGRGAAGPAGAAGEQEGGAVVGEAPQPPRELTEEEKVRPTCLRAADCAKLDARVACCVPGGIVCVTDAAGAFPLLPSLAALAPVLLALSLPNPRHLPVCWFQRSLHLPGSPFFSPASNSGAATAGGGVEKGRERAVCARQVGAGAGGWQLLLAADAPGTAAVVAAAAACAAMPLLVVPPLLPPLR